MKLRYFELSQCIEALSHFFTASVVTEILSKEKRRGQSRVTGSMRLFKESINQNGLVDVVLKNMKYTWA